jgi:hypothetical protein
MRTSVRLHQGFTTLVISPQPPGRNRFVSGRIFLTAGLEWPPPFRARENQYRLVMHQEGGAVGALRGSEVILFRHLSP